MLGGLALGDVDRGWGLELIVYGLVGVRELILFIRVNVSKVLIQLFYLILTINLPNFLSNLTHLPPLTHHPHILFNIPPRLLLNK